LVLRIAGLEETKNPSGEKRPPPDSDPFNDAEFEEISAVRQARWLQSTSGRFQFDKRSQLLICVHNETLAAIAVIVVSIVRSIVGYKPPFPIPKTQSVSHQHVR
jgi:hypothetical protein